jgi:dimethylsulfoniopropionate demethylase
MPLWNALMEAGRDLDVRAGCPNGIERVEGGLLSYGNDMTRENTPHECGLGPVLQHGDGHRLHRARCALERGRRTGRSSRCAPSRSTTDRLPRCDRAWPLSDRRQKGGQVTSAAVSPDFGCGVAIGMVRMTHWDAGPS